MPSTQAEPARYVLTIGARAQSVTVRGERARHIAEWTFSGRGNWLPADATPITLESVGEEFVDVLGPGAAAERLSTHVTVGFGLQEGPGLFVHAAAVALDGRGILLPARSTGGKSTLTGAFLRAGFQYLTDDLTLLVGAEDHGLVAHGLLRALRLRRDVADGFLDNLVEGESFLRAKERVLVSPSAFGTAPLDAAPLTAVVIPNYAAGSPPTLEPASPATAFTELITSSTHPFDPDRYRSLAAACRVLPAFRLTYSDWRNLPPLDVLRVAQR